MAREPGSISVIAADPHAHRPVLETLLEEYHTWLATEAREWAAERESETGIEGDAAELLPNDEGYDPAAASTEDGATIAGSDADARAFLAADGKDASGVVLLYGVSTGMAEIKRLYVRPERRGEGVGRALCRAAIDSARARGYERIGLTTPPWSEGAHALYEELGFEYTEPYPETKLPAHLHDEALFMQRPLTS